MKTMIDNYLDCGAECYVYDLGNNTVFKLYKVEMDYDRDKVQVIVETAKEYAERELGPAVLSGVIEFEGEFGYITEKVMTFNEFDGEKETAAFREIADKLGFSSYEFWGNIGIDKNGNAVLYDFGLVTIRILELCNV